MNRLEEIKERNQESLSFTEWFEDEWNRNKGAIDDIIAHNKQLSGNVDYLLQRLQRYEEALKEITEIDLTWDEPLPTAMRRLAKEALKDEIT